MNRNFLLFSIIGLFMSMSSCINEQERKEVALYNTHCASCHKAPEIDQLPKHIWEENILPRMAARMGIPNPGYNPKEGLTFSEQEAVLKSGIYSVRPAMSNDEWKMLQEYIISMAPDSLPKLASTKPLPLKKFKVRTLNIDRVRGSWFTFLDFDDTLNQLRLGTMAGNLLKYDFDTDSTTVKHRFSGPIVDYFQADSVDYTSLVGVLRPTEIRSGSIVRTIQNEGLTIADQLHRPVNTLVEDLNADGNAEFVVSEFGHLSGELSLLTKDSLGIYTKTTLLGQPGMLRTIAKDMNADGKLDLVVASSQGDEGIWILYQQNDLEFRREKVIRFSPVSGTSWFELLDYDGDGDQDIITVHGDNADHSYVHKPYHGVRVHLNDGADKFEEVYFYPMYGATRVLVKDFDGDNDIDIAVIAAFPNYDENPVKSFVYLENNGGATPDFTDHSFDEVNHGRWFLMDSGDIDYDGDEDIIISAFSYGFTPTPEDLEALWKEKQIDVLVLENQLVE